MLGFLRKLLGQDEEERRPVAQQPQARPQTPPQYSGKIGGQFGQTLKAFSPQNSFRMYEDNSFQGDPRAFRNPSINYEDGTSGPRFKFYEDNTFIENGRPLPQRAPSPMDELEALRRRLGL